MSGSLICITGLISTTVVAFRINLSNSFLTIYRFLTTTFAFLNFAWRQNLDTRALSQLDRGDLLVENYEEC